MSNKLEEKTMSKNKKAMILALVSLILVFVFMTLASCFNSSWGKVTIKDIYYPDANGLTMHGQLYIPDGVSADNPAPAILSTHGGSDYIQLVGNFALEMARRDMLCLPWISMAAAQQIIQQEIWLQAPAAVSRTRTAASRLH